MLPSHGSHEGWRCDPLAQDADPDGQMGRDLSRIWKARPREGYCKACHFLVAVGWRSGLIMPHAQHWARRFAENGITRGDSKRKDIDWCKGGGKPPGTIANPLDPWDPREDRREA